MCLRWWVDRTGGGCPLLVGAGWPARGVGVVMVRCRSLKKSADLFTKILNKAKRITCLSMMVLGIYYPDRIPRSERINRRGKIGTDDRPEIDW